MHFVKFSVLTAKHVRIGKFYSFCYIFIWSVNRHKLLTEVAIMAGLDIFDYLLMSEK